MYKMRTAKVNFNNLLSGEKDCEIRLCNEERKKLVRDESILIEMVEDSSLTILCEVNDTLFYDTFKQALEQNNKYDLFKPGISCYEDMYKYYTKEEESSSGVIVIKVKNVRVM